MGADPAAALRYFMERDPAFRQQVRDALRPGVKALVRFGREHNPPHTRRHPVRVKARRVVGRLRGQG